MSFNHICRRRLYSLPIVRSLAPRSLLHPTACTSQNLSTIFRSQHAASLHTSRSYLADQDNSASPPAAASIEQQPAAADSSDKPSDAEPAADDDRLVRALQVDSTATDTTAPTSSSSLTSSSDQLIRDMSKLNWSNPLAIDPTLYSEDMTDITQRLARNQPLTINQKIVLLQYWLDKLKRDPTEFAIHPALTWTHPRGKDQRPGREAPRMEEKFVPVEYDRREVDRLKLDERRRERRGRMSEYEAERKTYEMKVSDVRRAYMAEWRAVKQRRDDSILQQWRATKAASAQRRQQTAEAHRADESEMERLEEERYQQALQQRRQRLEVRVRKEEALRKKRAAQVLQLLEERRVKGVNQTVDASWGVRIDETLFAHTNKAVVGFWPSSMGPRAEE